ncbi:MAG: hypothetical protein LBH78_02220 [Rickettsiales bacterium]|nr:hypothetical protein [Rickettsiales bacterium]
MLKTHIPFGVIPASRAGMISFTYYNPRTAKLLGCWVQTTPILLMRFSDY